MERNTVIFEFLELRKQLNRGNKTADLVTAPSFVIEAVGESEFRLLFCVAGSFEVQRIKIARCDSSGEWERSGLTSFKNFENYCADSMKRFSITDPFAIKGSKNISIHINAANLLQKELDTLLVHHFDFKS
jgi:hypothetical protein